MIRRGYLGPTGRQVHYRALAPRGSESGTALICLHPLPYSGLYFERLMPLLNTGREVLAPDYPGYGMSDGAPEAASIGGCASALCDLARDRGTVDLLGFHTGCLVAVEMALLQAERVRSLVLIDAPCLDPADREARIRALADEPGIDTRLECLESLWQFNVTRRVGALGIERAFSLFTEHLRAVPGATAGFRAAFAYDWEERMPLLRQPALVVVTGGTLQEAARQAARLIPRSRLLELPEIDANVMEHPGVEGIAPGIRDFLASQDRR